MKPLYVHPHREPRRHRRLGVLVGPTRYVAETSGDERFSLDMLDLDAGETVPVRIPLNFLGHGLAVHPRNPHQAALLEKRGPGGCAVDLSARRVVRPIEPMHGHSFYGHGVYSREGDVLFVVETHRESHRGFISVRDSGTFAVLGIFPTYGMAPHDCHLIEDGRTLVITNGGGPIDSAFLPSVTFVDVKSRALLEKHEVIDVRRNTGHVAVVENREFAAVSAPRDGLPLKTSLGGVTLRRCGEPWVHMMAPDNITSRLVGESLSVAIHVPSRTVAATHPDADRITFWSLDRSEFAAQLELPGPRGVAVTLDYRYFVVSYGMEARLLFIQAEPFQVLADRRRATGAFGGAHLYAWAG
jgi:uncharacterized protein